MFLLIHALVSAHIFLDGAILDVTPQFSRKQFRCTLLDVRVSSTVLPLDVVLLLIGSSGTYMLELGPLSSMDKLRNESHKSNTSGGCSFIEENRLIL